MPIQLLPYVEVTAKSLDSGGQLGVQGPFEGSDQAASKICNFMLFYRNSTISDVFSWFSARSKKYFSNKNISSKTHEMVII